jgi:hypothetical protein
MITRHAPLIKAIGNGHWNRLCLNRILAGKPDCLPRIQRLSNVSANDLHTAAIYGDERVASIRISLYPESPRCDWSDRSIGSVNFHGVARRQFIHTDAQRALIQPELHDLVVQIGNRKISFTREANCVGPHLKFCSRVFVGIYAVAGGHGEVERGLAPLILTIGQERNFAFQVADPGSSRWGILLTERQADKKQQD